MKLNTTLALALLVGAGAILYTTGVRLPWGAFGPPPSPSSSGEGTRAALAGLSSEPPVFVAISRGPVEIATLGKTGPTRWAVSGNWPANPTEVNAVLDLLRSLHTRFHPEPVAEADLASLGLAPPELTVEVHSAASLAISTAALAGPVGFDHPLSGLACWLAARQHTGHTLALGEPTGTEYRFVRPTFLRLDGRDEIVRLAPGLIGEFARPADHYRQRRIFPAERTVRNNNPQERIERLDARELVLRQAGNPTLRLVQGAEGWELREPTRDHLDPENGQRLLAAVADLWAEQFAEGVSPFRSGVEAATQSLEVTRHDGSKVTLLLGTRSRADAPPPAPPRPDSPPPMPDTYRYARLEGSDLLFEVQDGRLNDIFTTLEILRDNRLARFASDDVERIELTQGGKRVVLVKEKKDSWKMVSPREAPADSNKVRDLLQKLSSLEAPDKDLFSPGRSAARLAAAIGLASSVRAFPVEALLLSLPASLGLDRPATDVRLLVREKARAEDRDRSKERVLDLHIGKPVGNRVFLQLAGWPRIDAMEDSLSPLLEKPSAAYRGKRVLDFAASDVARLEVRHPGRGGSAGTPSKADAEAVRDLVFVREGNEWLLVEPTRTPADAQFVNDLLDALGRLEALTYLADEVPEKQMEARYGLGVPGLEVKVAFQDPKKPARILKVGKSRAPEPGWFACLDNSTDVFALSGDLRDRLNRNSLAYLPSTLWQIAPGDEVVRYRIAKAGQQEYQLVRKDDAWQVIGPFTVAAPRDVVEGLSSALRSPRAEEYRSLGSAGGKEYGLTKPEVRLTLTTKNGKEHALWLGAPATGGKGGRYARLGTSPQVFVVSDVLARAVDQSALDFLDRNLLTFDGSAVASLERRQGKQVLELVKQEDAWKIAKPAEEPGDERKVPELLRQLALLRAERIVAYAPKDLEPLGLKTPTAVVRVKLTAEGKPVEHVLLIGKEEAGGRLAMVQGGQVVGLISGAIAQQVLAPVLSFRNHDLARVADADTMKLQAGERKITFARPEGTWKVSQPIQADADHDALEGYLTGLSRLRADSLIVEKPTAAQLAQYGLDRPSARWQLINGEEPKLDLTVGGLDPTGKRRYARLADRDLVFVLDEKLSSQATAEYRPRAVWKDALDPAQLESVRFGYRADPFELKKVEGQWQLVGKPDVKVDSAAVSDALSGLRELKLERYLLDTGAQLKLFGLDPPELVLEVSGPAGKHTLHLGGREGTSKRRYAHLPTSKVADVFVLDEGTSGKLFLPRPGEGRKKEGE